MKPGTHCRAGHEFTPENTVVHGSKRRCRICLAEKRREFYEANYRAGAVRHEVRRSKVDRDALAR